jgi:hypothetical protein
MATSYNELTEADRVHIRDVYSMPMPRKEAQEILADEYEVSTRTIRNWANQMQIGVMPKNITDGSKILIYDIETPRLKFWKWWSGKGYTNGNDLVREPKNEPRIITVAYKWFGEDKVYHLTWDKNQCDKKLMETFLKDYNEASLVVGINNDNFDNRWINARAAKHGLHVNLFTRSMDLQKQAKKFFRLPSYSLKYLCHFFGVTMKLSHEGIIMWDMVQNGTKEQQKEYLEKMVVYNVGDIVSTEEVYVKMIPYLDHKAHLGVLNHGNGKFSCPHCGETEKLSYLRDTVTKAGTIQRLMKCDVDGSQYKISNREYLNWLKGN